METSLDDIEQLINFFVIESSASCIRRECFCYWCCKCWKPVAMSSYAYILQAFVAAFIGYYLIKILPFWGLCLLSTSDCFPGSLDLRFEQRTHRWSPRTRIECCQRASFSSKGSCLRAQRKGFGDHQGFHKRIYRQGFYPDWTIASKDSHHGSGQGQSDRKHWYQ